MKTASAATVLSLSWLARSAAALPSSSVAVPTSTGVVPTATPTSDGFRSVAYFADWVSLGYQKPYKDVLSY